MAEPVGPSPSPGPEMQRNRLPTLFEVLQRRTQAPVDLFSFYVYMRDTQRAVDYLDFWLDVSQHMATCRHYVRRLHRSMIYQTPIQPGSKRSSQILDDFAGPSKGKAEESPDAQISAILRNENGSRHHSPAQSNGSNDTNTPPIDRPRPSFMTSQTGSPNNDPSPGQGSGDSPGQDAPTREDIRASAEKILYTYVLPGSEREIILPQSIVTDITNAIEGPEHRSDPEVFDAARDYVQQAMERDAFPGFLRSKALGNLVIPSMMVRLIVGLVSLFAAFWTSFILIFLDFPRTTRCWIILPFTVAIYLLFTHQYMLDPLMVLAGFSEYSFFSFVKIREPFVKKLLTKRALMVLLEVILLDAAVCCLFIFVPGKRL